MAFARVLGLTVAGRISHRAGIALTAVVLLLGLMSIWFWLSSANVLPWLVIQFGGMAIILWMASSKRLVKTLTVRWGVVMAVYAIAKLFEAADHQI